MLDPQSVGFSSVGSNVRIYDLTRITDPASITVGHDVVIDDFVFLQGAGGLVIGSHVHIASFVSITGGGEAIVADFCGISSGARVLTGTDLADGSGLIGPTVPDHLRSVRRGCTELGRHAFIGANAVIMPDVRIGEGAVVGAGAVVTRDVEPWTVNVGVPARAVGERESSQILAFAAMLETGS